MAPIRSPCPVVVTLHDASDWTMARGLESFWTVYMRILGIRAIRRAQAVVVPSRVVREDAARVCGVPPARVWVTPEGVSPRFRPVAPAARAPVLARHGIREPYVLYVGMLAPRKNLTRLVEAYARVSRQLSREAGCLVLAGPEGPAAAIRALAERLSIPHRVLLPGWIRDEDLPAIYAGARCLAYPSLAEGFGLPILEAQACGTAVLTSDRSSMPEVAGDAALYVDPLSVDSIAEGLHRLLTDGVLVRELAARGLERARLFTWERTAEATEQVYRAVHARQ
jgi:glycosyltransferase involved in cell wall biosynthesis